MSEGATATGSVHAMPGRPVERESVPGWSQSIELRDGTVVEGVQTLDQQWRRIAQFSIPDDLTGKRVLDAGASDGWFSFEMERRGAHVIALEASAETKILEAKKKLRSRIDVRFGDIGALTWRDLGTFDIILCFGVIEAHPEPHLALENICGMARDIVCLETSAGGDVEAKCRAAGFARIRLESTLSDRAHFTCFRTWEPATATTAVPELVCLENNATRNHLLSMAAHDKLDIYFKWPHDELTLASVFPVINGFGVPPVKVGRCEGGWQATVQLPPGLRPGWHDFTLRVANSAATKPVRIGVDVPDEARRYWPAEASNHQRIQSVTDGKTFERGRVRVGEGSAISVWVQGLAATADVADIRVRVNGADLPAIWLEPKGEGNARQVNAVLPPGTPTGKARLSIVVGGHESVAQSLELHT
jgi:SAM-dependent methyltransferase